MKTEKLKIKILGKFEHLPELEFHATNMKAVLSAIKFRYGSEVTNALLKEKFRYILMDSKNIERSVALQPEIMCSSFQSYDILLIVPDISGELPVAAVVGALAAVGVELVADGLAALLVTVVVNVALSVALSAVMSLLSPTPEYSSDPARTQQSNLFGGAPNIREQGGVVPLIMGAPFCGGVLISSGIFTGESAAFPAVWPVL